MDLLFLSIRLALAAVFGIAGGAKLLDLPGSRRALEGFGLPPTLAAPLGTLLPLGEIAVALLLLPASTAWWGAVGALGLLIAFVVAIAASMARGQTPDCHCFGQLHSEPVGWRTLLRNALLAVVAGVVVLAGSADAGPSALAWIGALSAWGVAALAGTLALLALLVTEGWMLTHLLRQNGRLLLRIEALEHRLGIESPEGAPEGLPLGTPAPAFELPDLAGQPQTLDLLRSAGKRLLLVFSDPDCGPCNMLLPEIARWQGEHSKRLTIVSVSRGSVEVNRSKSAEHGLRHVLLQRKREVAEAYRASATPSAVLISADGTIDSSLAVGGEAIRELVAQSAAPPDLMRIMLTPSQRMARSGAPSQPSPQPDRSRVGQDAPAFQRPTLDGAMFTLEQLRGAPTLVLFWNPRCGFCQRMLPDLRQWEAGRAADDPQLLLVSTGSVEENRTLEVRSPLVLDQGFEVGRSFGASGTPSAVLVDAEVKIASELVVGATAVLELARRGTAGHPVTTR